MPTILDDGDRREFSWDRLDYLVRRGLLLWDDDQSRYRLVPGKTWADVDAVCTACENGIHTPGISGMPRPCPYCRRQHYAKPAPPSRPPEQKHAP
jgi:hypothetical protein